MRLGRLSVKARLRGGFVFVVFLTGLLGLVALGSLLKLSQLTTELYEHPFTVNTTILQAVSEGADIRSDIKDLVDTHGVQPEAKAKHAIEQEYEVEHALRIIRQRYIGDPTDIDTADRALSAWRPVRDQIIGQVQQGRQAEAAALLRTTGEPLIAALQKALNNISIVSTSNARQFAAEAASHGQDTIRFLLVAFAIVVIGAIATAAVVTKSVLDQLRALRNVMVELAEGNQDVTVPELDGGGIVGQMAATIDVFKAMEARLTTENWIKTNISDFSTLMQNTHHPGDLAEHVIRRVCPLLGAGAGLFYIWRKDSERLELLASYGFSERKHVANSYRLGEGLVGQCGLEKQQIQLTEIPEDYIRITSGLGEAVPRSILVAPLLSKGTLVGIIEIATFSSLSKRKLALLDQLLPVVALNLELIDHARSTNILLEQTQKQAEELQASEEELRAQSEELQASNEELRMKSDVLQRQAEELRASEEELRAQREELQATNEELTEKSEALNERQKALELARDESEQRALELGVASRYKSEFLANMSHELRTPLNSLLILAKSLADNEEQTLTEDQIESAKIIHEGGNHLLLLINDILDLSKVEAGKMEVHLEDIPIGDLAQNIGRRFAGLAVSRQLSLSVEVDPDLPAMMRCDPGKVDQIINNLVGNALKFTRQGGVAVRLSRARQPLGSIAPAITGEAIAIAVTDTGVGVPIDKREGIFRAFEQADGSTSRQFGGTGLGLSISQKLAALLGGTITLDSVEGQGSTFTVLLPLISPTERPQERPPSSEIPAIPEASFADDRKSLSPSDDVILVIEDDDAFARILCNLAGKRGFKYLRAANGRDGLALARQFRLTGILLDIALPEMDGWTVMTQLKQMPDLRHIPVHFISAIDDSVRGLQMGAAGYLKKPVTKEQMDEVFDRLRHFAGDDPRWLLIVDDDAGSRKATIRLVQGERVEIVEAATGGEALALLREQRFDCMILDLILPDFSGFDLLDRAARDKISLPPVVVYSGKDLNYEENLKLREYTDSIVVKGARSPERLVDEVSLFLHSVQVSRPAESQPGKRSAGSKKDKDLAGRVVLIVDDDMRNAFALSKVLRNRGLKVIVAQDGNKALAHLHDTAGIELILMDIMMPGMDGYATMKEIRKDPRFKTLPILALTAKAMAGDREKCMEAGADDYLSKPIDTDLLLSYVRRYLSPKIPLL